MWAAGLVVTVGAGVLTAHGLIEVALGSTVPEAMAWLYPVITDGLALVAYAATTRLGGAGRGYAWSVVVLAAGLSAIAQAAYLAGGAQAAPAWLRFAVGAWPALAAAITAHLVFLIGTGRLNAARTDHTGGTTGVQVDHMTGVQRDRGRPVPVDHAQPVEHQLERGVPTGVQGVQVDPAGVQSWDSPRRGGDHEPGLGVSQFERSGGLRPALSPGDRALALAELHRRRSGQLPSVRALAGFAEVSQGTASAALKQLRDEPGRLHLVADEADARPPQ